MVLLSLAIGRSPWSTWISPEGWLGHHATESLDTERKRSYVEEEDILYITCEDTALD